MTTVLDFDSSAVTRENYLDILPDDALKEIFEWLIPSHLHTDTEGLDSLVPSWPAWVLSSVCARWRAVSLSHPRMWAVIKLNLSKPIISEGALEQALMDRLQLQLRRAGTHDLLICLWLSPPASKEDYPSLLQLLKTTVDRWRKLDINLPLDAYSALSNTSFPALTHLIITTVSLEDTHVLIDTFHSSPRLRDARHHHYQAGFCSIDLELPWAQILVYLSQNGCMTNLGQFSQLRFLELRADTVEGRLAPSILATCSASNPMVFPSLQHLYIWTIHPNDAFFVGRFLESINAPELRMISMTFTDIPSLKFPNLRYHPLLLGITLCIFELVDSGRRESLDQDILTVLHSIPVITILQLEQTAISSKILRGICNDGSQVILPSLKTFIMNAHQVDGLLDDLATFLASRGPQKRCSSSCATLETLIFTSTRSFERRADLVSLAGRFEWLECRCEGDYEGAVDVASILIG